VSARWLGLLVLVAGCAAAPPAPITTPLLDDSAFAAPSERIDTREIFAMSEAMRRYVRERIEPRVPAKGRQYALHEALYTGGQLKLDYDARETRNAARAFDERAGNCLSLVVMTAAFAKALGLEVTYQRVVADAMWLRSGDTYFASAHVNVTLTRGRTDPRARADERVRLTIDFIPPKENQVPDVRDVPESTVVAMFLNNRAAEAFAAGRIDDAYWWAREAIVQAPEFASAYNTLGVIYKHRGRLAQAERVLEHVLAREPGNLNAMQNLALVYQEQGRSAEADALGDKVERAQPYPPFHFFDLGRQALAAGDARKAKALFAREVERDPYYHEFHYWLAVAYLRLGEKDAAQKHLEIARDYGATRDDQAHYRAKLLRLGAGR
jgi:tetratricopeptide (TPR) repeat protein